MADLIQRMKNGQALVPKLPCVDFVLVYELNETEHIAHRKGFERAMEREGLQYQGEEVGEHMFVKIYAPFNRLCLQAERMKLQMPLKGCDIDDFSEPTCCTNLSSALETENVVDFVSAPFSVSKSHLFEGIEDANTFFRSSIRGLLVYNILTNLDIRTHSQLRFASIKTDSEDLMKKRGLLYLLMKKCYVDAFVLHDKSTTDPYNTQRPDKSIFAPQYQKTSTNAVRDVRTELDKTWTKMLKYQPLWKIRNYFGEKIALYFAWQGTLITLLWFPAVAGFCIFLYGLYLSSSDDASIPCDKNSTYSNHTSNCHSATNMAAIAEDVLRVIRQSFDNKCTPYLSLLTCIWGSIFLEIWQRVNRSWAYQWDVANYEDAEPDRPEFYGTTVQHDPLTNDLLWIYPFYKRVRKFALSACVVCLAILVVFASVTLVLLYKVYIREMYCIPGEGSPTCLVLVTFIPAMLNGCSTLALGRLYNWIAIKLTDWGINLWKVCLTMPKSVGVLENHRTQSDYSDSLIIKIFAFQFANSYTSLLYLAFIRPEENGFQDNGLFGLGHRYKDTCTRGSCMSLLSFQVFTLMVMKPMPKFMADIIWPKLKSLWRVCRFRRSRKVTVAAYDNYIEREFYKPRTEKGGGDFTLSEFTEKILEYGYVVMFAASFPLAPLIALIINLSDLRVDAKRLLWWNRRPIAVLASDIGMWFPILRFVSFIGVVTNAFIIAFTSKFTRDLFNVDDMDAGNDKRLLIVLLFEHIVFGCMYFIHMVVPNTPLNLKLAARKEKYHVSKILEYGFPNEPVYRRTGSETTLSTTLKLNRSDVSLTKSCLDIDNSLNDVKRKQSGDSMGESLNGSSNNSSTISNETRSTTATVLEQDFDESMGNDKGRIVETTGSRSTLNKRKFKATKKFSAVAKRKLNDGITFALGKKK